MMVTARALHHTDPATELLVAIAATRLQQYGGPFDDRLFAEDVASQILGVLIGEDQPDEMGGEIGEAMLARHLAGPMWSALSVAHALGRAIGDLVEAQRQGWPAEELEQLALGRVKPPRLRRPGVTPPPRTVCHVIGCGQPAVHEGVCATHRAR